MTFVMQANSTISGWQAPDGSNILFPEMEIKFGKGKKLRGGAPVCCPNFGNAPTDGPYEGVVLPKHGLVRTCGMEDGRPVQGNRALHQDGPEVTEDGWTQNHYIFQYPCFHEVWVSAKLGKSQLQQEQMRHRISLGTEAIHDVDMPYSIGFHPYFATAGGNFLLRHAGQSWKGRELTVDDPFYIPANNPLLDVVTQSFSVQIEIVRGYTGFYVWTDRPDLYICVEPVRVDPEDRWLLLQAGEATVCECLMTYSPRS